MFLGHLVEKLDDVGKVHLSVEDDVSVGLDEGQRNKEVKVRGDDAFRGPYRLPDVVGVRVSKFALEIQ